MLAVLESRAIVCVCVRVCNVCVSNCNDALVGCNVYLLTLQPKNAKRFSESNAHLCATMVSNDAAMKCVL